MKYLRIGWCAVNKLSISLSFETVTFEVFLKGLQFAEELHFVIYFLFCLIFGLLFSYLLLFGERFVKLL